MVTKLIGHVKRIGCIYAYKGKNGPGENSLFDDKVVIVLSITPSADAWPDDRNMADYVWHRNSLLLKYGILSFEAYEEFQKDKPPHITIATEFPSLNAAKRIFQLAVDAGIVGIYLYQNGKLEDKYD